jgi:hypothetical protein
MKQAKTVKLKQQIDVPASRKRLSPKFTKTRFSLLVLIGLVLIVLIGLLTLAHQRRGGEAGRLTRELNPYIQLPDETPSIATISDQTKLTSQTFFQQAHNGDKLIIYPKSREVILYRPSIHKVIDIAPIAQ